ncbi:hypothetical protein GCM10022227_21030 [Streptomyces sedi]
MAGFGHGRSGARSLVWGLPCGKPAHAGAPHNPLPDDRHVSGRENSGVAAEGQVMSYTRHGITAGTNTARVPRGALAEAHNGKPAPTCGKQAGAGVRRIGE